MVIYFNSLMYLGSGLIQLGTGSVHTTHSLEIGGAYVVNAETCQYLALYDNNEVLGADWQVVTGNQYATIDSTGLLTILAGASGSTVEISCEYAGLTATKELEVTYVSGSSAETETETEIIVDPTTGQTTETTTTTTTTTDAQGNVTTETTTSEIVTNQDGTSTQSETTETVNPDGSSVSTSETVNYSSEGEVVGSSTNETNVNADGSSTSSTTNYNADGDPTTTQNESVDTSGNVDTQDIEYNENGDPVVTGYDIDTSASGGEGKQITGGVNTEYYAFDPTRGFILDFEFSIDFANQPAGQDENHHNILTAKRSNPSPWYGFQIRHSSTNKYVQLGTQFSTGANVNTTISPVSLVGDVASYNLRITYDPTLTTNTFVCTDIISGNVVYSSNGVFPDIETLRYLKVTLGYAMDPNGEPYRYSSINVKNFNITKLTFVEAPTISCVGGKQVIISCEDPNAVIYYRLNQVGNFVQYINPIVINEDTIVEAYAEIDEHRSITVQETCIYSGLKNPVISCDGEFVTITCDTADAVIYYRLNQTGEYIVYTDPIQILADTVVESYAEKNGTVSDLVTETCIYDPVHDYSQDYLTFRALSDGTIAWKATGSGMAKTIEYSVNDGEWTSLAAASTPATITVATGDEVRFRGNNTTYAKDKSNYSGFDGGTATYDIEGNVMSLIYGDNFANQTAFPASSKYNFCSIFKQSNAVSAKNLVLPVSTLTEGCYRAMFSKAAQLVEAPSSIPATTLAKDCCWYMFEECPITAAPELPAPTLVQTCYGYMFIKCTSLTYIKCLATSGFSTTNCLQNWVQGITTTGKFVKARGVVDWITGASGIPTKWTVYEEGDELQSDSSTIA